MSTFAVLGKSLLRSEDERFLTGRGRYIGDMEVAGALHVVFVRSPHGHARIASIETSAALAMAGVVAVWGGPDIAKLVTTARVAPPIEGLKPVDLPPFPVDRVRFVGDLVAAVVAETHALAVEAAEAVAVDYEPLPVIASIDAARAPGAASVDDEVPGNHISHQEETIGDVARRFADADRVVTARFSQHRQTHVPLEPRGCIADWDVGRKHLTLHWGNQASHPMRSTMAARLRLKEHQVTIISPDVGGAFGQKIAVLREELTCAALSIALARPVRWSETRTENLLASLMAREEAITTRAAVTAAGRIMALEARIEADFGAYCFFPANYMARVIAMILPGPYKIDAYAYSVDAYLTNKCPASPMRAPMSSTSWIMEGTVDAIARELGLDPVEVRRLNSIEDKDLPFTTVVGERYVDVTPRETLDAAVERIGYDMFRKRQRSFRSVQRYVGLGLCTVVEPTTYGSAFYKKSGIPGSGHETATVRIEPSGAVLVSCGLGASGQGYETTLAQCCAEGLGAKIEEISVRLGNSDVAPYGMGSRGARGATVGGGVVLLASQRLSQKVLAIAGAMLGLNSADGLRLREGRVERLIEGSWQSQSLTLPEIARTAHLDPLRLPAGMEPGLHLTMSYDPPPMTYANATHACEVEVDTRTGQIDVLRYVVAHDCGTEINPMIVAGQVHGATAMGLSGVLMEHCHYEAGGQNLAATFMDYAIARSVDLPNFEIIDCNRPNRLTPAGIKGMSEGGVMGAIGALCNAVSDALAPLGVVVEAQPLTPDRVLAAIWRAQQRQS